MTLNPSKKPHHWTQMLSILMTSGTSTGADYDSSIIGPIMFYPARRKTIFIIAYIEYIIIFVTLHCWSKEIFILKQPCELYQTWNFVPEIWLCIPDLKIGSMHSFTTFTDRSVQIEIWFPLLMMYLLYLPLTSSPCSDRVSWKIVEKTAWSKENHT